MRKLAICFLLLITIFGASTAWSADISSDSLDRLITLSGIKKQVAEIPGMVRLGAEQARQQGARISDADFEKVLKAMDGAFQSSEIVGTISLEIRKSISESDAKKLLAWYESDLGRKITIAEEKASTPKAYQEMMATAKSLLADEKRVELARRLDEIINVTDMMMQLQEFTGIAVFTAISKALNPDQPVQVETYKSRMRESENQIRTNIRQVVIISSVFSYKDIDIESIKKYVDFNDSPNMRHFNDGVKLGMKNALNTAIEKMATSLGASFKKPTE